MTNAASVAIVIGIVIGIEIRTGSGGGARNNKNKNFEDFFHSKKLKTNFVSNYLEENCVFSCHSFCVPC